MTTWDDKDLKAIPLSVDEILIIDVSDSRNQKRASLGSAGLGIWTRSGGIISHIDLTDKVAIGILTSLAKLTVVEDTPTILGTWSTDNITGVVDNNWQDIAFGNGIFVAISNTGSGNRVMTSPDGLSWTIQSSAANNDWQSVAFGNGVFVAVAGTGTNRIMISTDGINWTSQTPTQTRTWNGIGFGGGLFVIVGDSAPICETSPDGINWTVRTLPSDNNWQAVTHGNGKFVAIANAAFTPRSATSTDGITWVGAGENLPFLNFTDIAFGNGVYVAINTDGANRVYTSPDGTTWTARTAAVNLSWRSIAFGNGQFVAVSDTGTGDRSMTSTDGITWQTAATPVDNNWDGVAFANNIFVAVSTSGTGDRAMRLLLSGDASLVLDIQSTHSASRPIPSLTTGQRDLISTPLLASQIFNTDRQRPEIYTDFGTPAWLPPSVVPTRSFEIFTSTDLDALAVAGTITISVNTTLIIKGPVVTSNVFVVDAGITLQILGDFIADAKLTYSGSGTFFTSTSTATLRILTGCLVTSSSTGTMLSWVGKLNMRDTSIQGWDNLGTFTGTSSFLLTQMSFVSIDNGLIIIDPTTINMSGVRQAGTTLAGPLFIINTKDPNSLIEIDTVFGTALTATGSLFDIDTRVNNGVEMSISSCGVGALGNVFKQPELPVNATINSVVDSSPSTGTISAMADNGSGGTTISCTTTYFEDEEVTITGTTSYNGTFQIFNVVAGVSFDIVTAFVADDATGSVDSNRIDMTLASGNEVSIGMSIKVINTSFYNGFYTVLDKVSADVPTLNQTFVATDTGAIERIVGLDETDPRVDATRNGSNPNSLTIGGIVLNENSTVTTVSTQNVFIDINANNSIQPASNMERWKLIDDDNGTIEYIGNRPYSGTYGGHFSVLSPGSQQYHLRIVKDSGSGFAVLPDGIEIHFSTDSAAGTFPVSVPITAVKGDKFKVEFSNVDGTDNMTFTDLSMGPTN